LPAKVSGASRYRALDPVKDIESVHPISAGLLALGQPRYVPSTPASVFHLVDRYLVESGRDPAQTYDRNNLVVVGRSANVGKPALMLALERGATVVSCDEHSHGAGLLFEHTARADILVVAAGVPGLICGEHVKDGVIAVDVGINAISDPQTAKVRLVGDIDTTDVARRAEALTPVPGGVGPITDVWLLRNTVAAARLTQGIEASSRGPRESGETISNDEHRSKLSESLLTLLQHRFLKGFTASAPGSMMCLIAHPSAHDRSS